MPTERRGLERVSPSEVADASRVADEQRRTMEAMAASWRSPIPSRARVGRVARRPSVSERAPDPVQEVEREGVWRLSLAQIGRQFASGALTPPALLAGLIDRIDEVDSRLDSFVALDHAGARAAADASGTRWATGTARGPLDGVPVGIKDVIDVAGLPTRCHSRTTSTAPVDCDAAIVARLRGAGAIILGKLATHEFAIGGPAFDLPFPPARNPWDRNHHPGGSSSGAGAAVAAGLVPLAVGTDTAGSVRNPASACGVVGLKPGRGVLPLAGIVPLSWTLDHLGLLTRSAEDMAIAAEALGAASPARRIGRVGYVRHFHTDDMPARGDVAAALDRVAALFDAEEVRLPPLGGFALVNRVILQSEGFAAHATDLRARPGEFSAMTRAALLPGAFLPAETLALAYYHRTLLTAAVDAALEAVDILLTASSMEPACRIDDPPEIARSYMLQARTPFNVTGHPALAMMAGLSAEGLPLSVQFASRMEEEGRLIAAAARWEQALGGPPTPQT